MEHEVLNGTAKETTKLELNGNDESKLFEAKPVGDTPFTAIKLEDKWYLTLGKYRLTEALKSFEEVEQEAKDASWWRILSVMQAMITEFNNNQNKND